MSKQEIIVIGGGAAGFFTAINIAEKHEDFKVIILEKSSKTLSKVSVSGGGRCNVTNQRSAPSELVPFYPRGEKKMYPVFKQFSTDHMRKWLAERGVETVSEGDKRVFPLSNRSQTIIDCFMQETAKHRIELKKGEGVVNLQREGSQWLVTTHLTVYKVDAVVFATGSSPSAWKLLAGLGLQVVAPVPSLFTFNIKDPRIASLPGVSFDQTGVKIVGSKLSEEGPMMITHWGLSGPAILKLSSIGAIDLHQRKYRFEILINFLKGLTEDEVRSAWHDYISKHASRRVINQPLWGLPKRFWEQMIKYCGISTEATYGQVSKKSRNKLIEELIQGRYQVDGKSTFKEEFVTAGGVELSEVDLNNFSAKRFPGLYLAGEVLNIDALTGGFNFQACWSAGWLISEAIASE